MSANLILMCGIPGSGKTTFAKKYCQEHKDIIYISRDEIRFGLLQPEDDYFAHEGLVYHKFIQAVAAALNENKTVIADATFLNKGSRQRFLEVVNTYVTVPYDCYAFVMQTPIEICLERNSSRKGRANVPENTIRNMFNKFSNPSVDTENFKMIYFITENNEIGFIQKSF